jgi:hypothetical protein
MLDDQNPQQEANVFARLERALSALERSFAALGTDDRVSEESRARAAEAAAALRETRDDLPLSHEDEQRLQAQVRSLQAELRQLEQVVGKIYGTLEEEEWPKGV